MPPSRSASPTDRLLITGGAGFIGSHTALVLLEAGQSLVVLDDLSNSSSEALRRVAQLAGLAGWRQRQVGLWATDPGPVSLVLRQGDIRSPGDLAAVFSGEALQRAGLEPGRITAVLHFAGLKSVPESVGQPLRYWDVNVGGSRSLFEAMARHECRTVVFSSSASIYGLPETVPIPETTRPGPINPYGGTKAAAEQQLREGLGRLFAVVENYPDLKADQGFKHLQSRITELEESIADRRELYNEAVNLSNIRIQTFPDLIVARMFDFRQSSLLEFAEEQKRDVDLGKLFG